MAFVVTEPCFGCKYTDCVVVCPVDCFREGEQMLYIDPEVCTECEACMSECPVEAIYHEDNVPDEWREYIALNAEMAKVCRPIVERKPPLGGSGEAEESRLAQLPQRLCKISDSEVFSGRS